MTDFTQNMSAFKDPRVFVPWFNAVTEPGFYTTMGNLVMDPAGWLRMMNSMVDPGAYRNVAEFADPNVYMGWLAASMDPNFYNALVAVMTDPGKMMRWAMLPVDPKLWGMMMNSLNPGMYMKWMMARLIHAPCSSPSPRSTPTCAWGGWVPPWIPRPMARGGRVS